MKKIWKLILGENGLKWKHDAINNACMVGWLHEYLKC